MIHMNRLPLEIVHRILEYDGTIKYRHGKYMNQIAQDDDRYKILQTIPQIKPFYHHFYYMKILDNRNRNIIYCEKHIIFDLDEELSLVATYSNIKYITYIYNNQGFQYKLTIYKPSTPTFIESVLQYIFTLCAVNSYKYFVI